MHAIKGCALSLQQKKIQGEAFKASMSYTLVLRCRHT